MLKSPVVPAREGRCARLVVVALEVGGRWSSEAWAFVKGLALSRAREEPILLRKRAAAAWHRRFVGLLAVAAQRSFAESLLERASSSGVDGAAPTTNQVLEDARYAL